MRVKAVLLGAMVLVAGCATPSQRVSTKLISYGVPEPQAVCMGDRLQQRLTISQLKRIGAIGKASRDTMGRVTVAQVAAALDKPGDEALVAEVLKAGVGCLF